jgi:hypothetical protein
MAERGNQSFILKQRLLFTNQKYDDTFLNW